MMWAVRQYNLLLCQTAELIPTPDPGTNFPIPGEGASTSFESVVRSTIPGCLPAISSQFRVRFRVGREFDLRISKWRFSMRSALEVAGSPHRT